MICQLSSAWELLFRLGIWGLRLVDIWDRSWPPSFWGLRPASALLLRLTVFNKVTTTGIYKGPSSLSNLDRFLRPFHVHWWMWEVGMWVDWERKCTYWVCGLNVSVAGEMAQYYKHTIWCQSTSSLFNVAACVLAVLKFLLVTPALIGLQHGWLDLWVEELEQVYSMSKRTHHALPSTLTMLMGS